ncbi:hypothetical protein CHS0354_012898 [Potamilus streckersoni]|uniref:Uncharacterized protein n=1 Tax=Potamilus streckersoni TaxID=2493646 RepID=A0AAE0SAW9_9BIVA|nr:hypothetical protein CHS0354_012898 [Potamilus streckersoni]
MKCTYNNMGKVRAELTDFCPALNTSTEIYTHHMDSDSTKIKTYPSFTEPVIPRELTMVTSLIEKEFTLNSLKTQNNRYFTEISQPQGFKGIGIIEKEQEKKLTQFKSLKLQQCTLAHDQILEDDLVEKYLDSKLQDPLILDQTDCTLNLENEYTVVYKTEYNGNGSNSSIVNTESSRVRYSKQNNSVKLNKSTQYESVPFDSGIDFISDSVKSDSSSKSESDSLHSQLESIDSTKTLLESCTPNSLGDSINSAQSVCMTPPESNMSEMLSQYDSHNGSESVFDNDQKELHFSTWPEFSHFDTLEKWPYLIESISFPTKCTEGSVLTLPEDEGNVCFSTCLESCQSDRRSGCPRESNHPTKIETSLPAKLGQAVLVDNEMESNYLRNSLSHYDQRHSKIQAVMSDHPSDSTFKIGHETGRFNKSDTELDVYEKPNLMRPEVFCEGVQRPINEQNKVYYWRQVMQFYFTHTTTLSIIGSLKWLFQLRLVSIQALQRLLSFLHYPFNNLNAFFSRESSNSPPSAEECMSVEWMRLQTFQNYPITANGSPNRLAREGFYYTGQGTQTRCFSCGVTHGEWNYLDNPHRVHQRLSPNCPFLNGRQEGHRNIPMSPDRSADDGRADGDSIPFPSLPVATLTGSSTGQSQVEGSRSISTTKGGDDRIWQNQSGPGETTLGVPSHPVEESPQSEADNRPKFPEHVSLPSRIATYSHGWPPYLDQTPQQMAEAGFFFTGNQDYTRCYQCGGGLRNWEPGDNPWIEHCRWYPTCPHVQKVKGQRFVNAVLKKQAELLSVQRAESRRKVHYGIGITDPLETLGAITLLEMGYPRDTVRNSILILRRLREPGADITAMEVLDFIWNEEDIERQQQEEEASRPHRPGHPQPPALPTLMERLNLGGSPAAPQAIVQQSASITTTTSSLTTVAMTTKSATTTISSTSLISGITSVSTSTLSSGSILSISTLGQGQRLDEGQGHSTIVGGNGSKSGGSMYREDISEGSVGRETMAMSHQGSEQGEQRPSGAMAGGQAEGPGAHAQAIAAAINEDEEFHSLEFEEMENKEKFKKFEQQYHPVSVCVKMNTNDICSIFTLYSNY